MKLGNPLSEQRAWTDDQHWTETSFVFPKGKQRAELKGIDKQKAKLEQKLNRGYESWDMILGAFRSVHEGAHTEILDRQASGEARFSQSVEDRQETQSVAQSIFIDFRLRFSGSIKGSLQFFLIVKV